MNKYENLDNLNRYLLKLIKSGQIDKKSGLGILKKMNEGNEKIAIIGMACNLPGSANKEEFWLNTARGLTFTDRLPKCRKKDTDEILKKINPDLDLDKANPYFTGGFLEAIDKFDNRLFDISDKEALVMDPYHRLMLESVFETIEDAGYLGVKIKNSNTGVFMGVEHTNKILSSYINYLDMTDLNTVLGSWTGVLAGRIANIFDLIGPTMVIDSACASGLVALQTACRSIQKKDCSMAIVGGINLFVFPNNKISVLPSPDKLGEKTRVFDKKAVGTYTGEGVVSLLLKPLKRAINDGDKIYSIIEAGATTNNGGSCKVNELSSEGIKNTLANLFEKEGINPETISYIEPYGFASTFGDSIEISGMNTAFRKYTDKAQFCALGSIKANVGHLLSASGLAALTKTVFALKNKKLPPCINFEEPNSLAKIENSVFYINDKLIDWEKENVPRRAGVYSFGFGGTNSIIILEEPPKPKNKNELVKMDVEVLTISAFSEKRLGQLIDKYFEFLSIEEFDDIYNLCYTANTGRNHYNYRIAITFKDRNELIDKLAILRKDSIVNMEEEGIYYNKHEIVQATKKEKLAGNITEGQKRQATKSASEKINALLNGRITISDCLEEICFLYIKGADVPWKFLYKDKRRRIISIPKYPMDKKRFWPTFGQLN